MRALIAAVLLCVATLIYAQDFQEAFIVDAGTSVQGDGGAVVTGFGGFATVVPSSSNVSVITLQIGTLKVTGEYKTILQGPRAASNLIVGDKVMARTDGKWVYFVMPGSGKTIKAKIMRQERL
jgi:hypothetical protein